MYNALEKYTFDRYGCVAFNVIADLSGVGNRLFLHLLPFGLDAYQEDWFCVDHSVYFDHWFFDEDQAQDGFAELESKGYIAVRSPEPRTYLVKVLPSGVEKVAHYMSALQKILVEQEALDSTA